MRKAGRKTGPEAEHQQHRRRRDHPLPAFFDLGQRGAIDTFRNASITTTSISARFWSFSRFTSVTIWPSSDAT